MIELKCDKGSSKRGKVREERDYLEIMEMERVEKGKGVNLVVFQSGLKID